MQHKWDRWDVFWERFWSIESLKRSTNEPNNSFPFPSFSFDCLFFLCCYCVCTSFSRKYREHIFYDHNKASLTIHILQFISLKECVVVSLIPFASLEDKAQTTTWPDEKELLIYFRDSDLCTNGHWVHSIRVHNKTWFVQHLFESLEYIVPATKHDDYNSSSASASALVSKTEVRQSRVRTSHPIRTASCVMRHAS